MSLTLSCAQKALLLSPNQKLIFLIKYQGSRYTNSKLAGKYGLPGGKISGEEDDLDASMVREVLEETGLIIKPGPPITLYTWKFEKKPGDLHRIVAIVRKATAEAGHEHQQIVEEQESTISGSRWFEIDQIPYDLVVVDEVNVIKRSLDWILTTHT